MNKQELQGAFSQIHASDDLIREVLSVEMKHKKGTNIRRIAWQAAAIAAAVAILITAVALWPADENYITAPGIVKVYACEIDNKDEYQIADYSLYEGMDPLLLSSWCPMGELSIIGIPISLKIENEDLREYTISFDITANYGELTSYEWDPSTQETGRVVYGKKATIDNGGYVCWNGKELVSMRGKEIGLEKVMAKVGNVYVDVIIRADNNIVGYVRLEMVCTNPHICLFNVKMIASVYYPKVNGEFQTITEEYIQRQLR